MTDGIFTFVGTTSNGVFNSSGTGQAVVGEVEKITFTNTSWTNGSVFITDVKTNETILTQINVSGTNPIISYPRTFVEDTTSTSLSGTNAQSWDKLYVHGPVLISGLGLGSTAAGTVGTVHIYYR